VCGSALPPKYPLTPTSPEPIYQVKDLAGCEVWTSEGELLGTLSDVLPSGGNDIFVVVGRGHELLIPARKQVVRSIDLTARRIEVALPAGLRDIYEV
jgi:16S rRNA processing protein RimM